MLRLEDKVLPTKAVYIGQLVSSTTPSSSTLYVAFTTKMSVIRCRIWPWARPRPWPLLVSPRADVLGVDI